MGGRSIFNDSFVPEVGGIGSICYWKSIEFQTLKCKSHYRPAQSGGVRPPAGQD